MGVLTRYIAVEVLRGVALTIAVLLAVTSFVDLVRQLDDIGINDYGIAEALAYIALRLPGTVVETLAPATLIGALLGLGNLAVHRELVVMRASGVSHVQLLGSVGAAGLMLVVMIVLLGESLAPSLGAYAREMRTRALHEDLVEAGQSIWLKSGDRVWNLRRQLGEFSLGRVYLFELAENGGLKQIARADAAELGREEDWLLENYAGTHFVEDGVATEHRRVAEREYALSSDLVSLSVVRADLLDTPSLERYIRYLKDNGLDTTRYEIAYWSRMANVVSVLLMCMLALPFVLGGRWAGKSGRLVLGLVIGLAYYVGTQMLVSTGEVFELDPRWAAWAPSAVLLLVTGAALARLR